MIKPSDILKRPQVMMSGLGLIADSLCSRFTATHYAVPNRMATGAGVFLRQHAHDAGVVPFNATMASSRTMQMADCLALARRCDPRASFHDSARSRERQPARGAYAPHPPDERSRVLPLASLTESGPSCGRAGEMHP